MHILTGAILSDGGNSKGGGGDGAERACQAGDAMCGEDGPYSIIREFVLWTLCETD